MAARIRTKLARANLQLLFRRTQWKEVVSMKHEITRTLMVIFLLLYCSMCLAQTKPMDSTARQQIDAGNQAWIDGVKQGNVELITATYTSDAVDCSPTGNCIRGRSAIRDHMKEEFAKLGKAQSASVTSIGSV